MTLTPPVTSAEKLLQLARAARLQRSSAAAPIEPADRSAPLPLSFAQQRLWFLEQLGGLGDSYHMPTRLRLEGELDGAALRRALDAMLARHEALRTTFVEVEGEPVQRIAEESRFHLLEHDLGDRPDAAAELRRLAGEEARAPFDLEQGPLIRGRLVRLSADDHVLLMTMHHIVSDGWSMEVLTRELDTLYDAFRRGEANPLPPLPVQYADYAIWQRKWVDGEVLRRQAEYWKTTLAGAPELLELPTDRPRPARQDHAGGLVWIGLGEELTAGLKALSQRHGATLFMTLLAGWAAVLGRLSGQDDVVVGTPSANRGRAEIEGLIGFFVNTLALRVDLSGSPTVAELLERVRARALGAQQNQDIPFEQVVELVQPARSLAHAPLFQAMLTWQNAVEGRLELPAPRQGGAGPASRVAAKVDLSLTLWEAGGRIVGNLVYATALFEQATIERHLAYLRRVLEAMVADDLQAVDALPLLPEDERRRVVEEWNATDAAYPRESCIHELFEAQAARAPGAVAVLFEGGELTYAELNARANRLAHHLVGRGVGPGARVAICVERGPEMVAGLLAILKAGGAYVPLDPGYPAERLRYMLEDGAPAAVLTQGSLEGVEALFAGVDLPVIDLEGAAWARCPATDPARAGLTPGHLAYVIYTSGSTGTPKGVMIEHRSLANHTAWQAGVFGIGPGDTVLQRTSISFDASVWELWTTLAVGARLALLPVHAAKDPGAIARVIEERGVTVAQFVPTLLEAVLRGLPEGAPLSPRIVFCGGEPLSAALVAEARAAGVGEVVNLYGPTEATIDSTWHRCGADERAPSIGRPIANVRVYVLDGAGEPVPVGVAGELYVGGAGVARGYLDRPVATAERFVPDPFSGIPGARLYRTGDLARWRTETASAVLEFLGRNDFQVKVRGFRIELGEIEARLREHAGVREAVVLAREDEAGDRRLVAYWVGDAAGIDALRAHLSGRLPEHMVPAAYVHLDALPLTPSGKVDRKALPAPEGDAYARRGYEAPVGETEAALAEIWCELLKVERVGRRDHFFELGGHSLLAVRVISRVRQVLGAEVAIAALFERPVLADLARAIESAARIELPPIEPVERSGALALSFAQQRLWFLDHLNGAGTAYHIPTQLRLVGELDREALVRTLDRIVARHEALRTAFPARDGVPAQRIVPVEESRFHLAEHDLSGDPDAQAALRRLLGEEARTPFDLAQGPLIRGRLIRLADDDHVLHVTMHHIVSDGWSMGVFTRELSALYGAFRRGEPDPLPPLPVQYADYAAWQRRWVEGEVLQAQAAYWTETLGGAPELLELPTDRPRPARHDPAGASVGVVMDEALTAGLKALGQRHGTTPFMTVLAGWAVVLGRLSGQHHVVVGTPSANRGRTEIEGLIGFFVNTLALRVDLAGSPSVAEVLARVKERALGAQQHQDIPFEQVVELVQPARSMSYSPLFQVMLTWQNASGGRLELPGLRLGDVGSASQPAAKFDLSLTLWESGGCIVGSATYATSLFERATVERWAGYLRRVLEEMAADDARRVERLALMPESERALVVEAWNRTDEPFTDLVLIHRHFEAQAARAPGATAVEFGGESLTYAELDARANRLAHRLVELGVRAEDRVALCLEPCSGAIVGLLGVMKAGAAYVPLDPAAPDERTAFMLAECGARIVLADAASAARPWAAGCDVLRVDGELDAELERHPATPPAVEIGPRHLAYVLYTSGSTGLPKGVLVEHGGVCNTIATFSRLYGNGPRSRVLLFAPLHFDASVLDVFTALANGGTLVVAPREETLPGEELTGLLARKRITHAKFTPSALAATPWAPLPELEVVILGGEVCSAELVERWAPGRRFFNGWGPTEVSVRSTAVRATDGTRPPPIGRPLGNVTHYVLDGAGWPVPVGVPGEIYVGGAGVTRGYLGRPALTAEKFVPDPFAKRPGARMYRTGDRVRWRADGMLDFVARMDGQVKVRGFRIELGEIEAVLRRHEGIADCVVMVREDVPGEQRLVAYVVGEVEAGVLREHLRRSLPEYMVPAAFVRLEALPLTPNGKLDRKALPAPEGDAYARRGYEAPQGETEQALAEIWGELLKVERVGRHDHFFELGGHSLLAVRLISRVRQVLGAEVGIAGLFERPVLADLARAIDDAARTGLPAIEPADRSAPLPLSFAQQRLWFIERLEGAGAAYHITVRQRLRGALDRAALRRALDRIVVRHEALRTTFAEVDGAPVQRVAPAEESPFQLTEHDLRGDPGGGAELRRLIAEESDAPFDLARGPLIRGRLVQLGDEDHVLLITLHHIVSDGWSMGVLTRELNALYAAFRDGNPDPLAALPIQYADYAVWQRRWVEGEVLREQAAYWQETLAGAPELLELPTDHARPARQDFTGGLVGIGLGEGLTAGLKALSQRHGATLFMTLLAGWAAVLSRLSGQDDVVIGTPTANRGRKEIEGLIGFFVNTLALRVDLSDAPTVAELLARVKARALGAQQHQDIPFEQVVERVQPARSLSHTPLFQVMFTWRNASDGELELSGLEAPETGPRPAPESGSRPAPAAQAGEAARTTAKFDLSLGLAERDGRIVGVVEYAAALFERATVERFAGYLRRALEAMVADESQPVDRLPLLPEAERRLVVEEWNATGCAYPTDGLRVHDLFHTQAVRTPHAVALSWRGEGLTYAELEARANQVANALRRRGVGPEVRVGICLPRTPDLVVAMLGVLGAGGAYVPLDPAYPRERLGYMLEDARVTLVITDSALEERLPEGAATLLLDRDGDAIAAESTAAPESGVLPENLSHVIFTSGSTGRPKGVMIRHSSVVVLLHWLRENVTDEERSSVLFSTSINFDVSVAEVFGTLAWGGKLVLVENALELATLGEDMVHVSMVPSAAAELLKSGGIPACVKTLNLGGEALPNALAQGLYGLGTVEKVGNLYGPTEDTTYSTYYVVPRGAEQVLVGTPVANTRAYVLDAHLQPVPIGAVGELYLAGDGLSRGYANRPGMTAERFVPCPFGPPGSRMYRVMDRVRRRADGEIEYRGRTDFQVKVRGYRIELGEIEARLAEHPGVRAPVVIVREDAPGDRRLVAYYLGDEPAAVDALKAHLSDRLPGYMVPAAYVWMEAYPLTPNGKVDRRALPAPEGDAYAAHAYEAPVGETEEALAGIWAEVLGAERVGRHDNFFELGGHSLLAVRVISRVRQVLGAEVGIADLFERPVLADLARAIDSAARTGLPAIEPVERGRDLPLSFAQQRLWFIERLEGAGAAYHITVRQRLRGALDRDALRRALDRIVARHEALRTTFAKVDGEPVQRIAPAEESPFQLTEHDLRGHPQAGAELRRVMAEESAASFDLEHGPLIRGRLIQLADDDHVLLITMHHIVSDGWSMGVLTRELNALYAAFREGRSDPLAALPIQYADYAVWQRRWVEGEVLREQAAYWQETLAGAPELLELPTDHARPARQDFTGGLVDIGLGEGLTGRLKALGQRHGATLFMTLLAGWAAVLSRLSGQDDVVIGTPTANRGRKEIEGLIGFFVNTLALRVDLSDAPTVAELLARVKARALGAQQHQDIPFEQVVERVQPARSLSHTPLFQVMFTWQNAPEGELELSGLAAPEPGPRPAPQAGEAARTTAKFDLSLFLAERDGRIVGVVEYAAALFERATVERFAGYLRRALEAMVADESQPVDQLPLLPEAERRRVVEEWNATGRAYPTDGLRVHDLFHAQAARTPEVVALSWRGERLTYAELERRANQIANALRRRGVGPEVRVGICLPRTPDLVVAMLGVLGAGGAYVPLDPAYPRERLGYMVEDAGVTLVITESSLADRLPEGTAGLLLLDVEREAIAAESTAAPESGVLPGNLSHVIFTSGSTGRPKGVMIRHSSVVVLLHWLRENVTDEERSSVLFSTSINFDVSVAEVFGTLAWGGKLVLVENALELATVGEDVVHVSMVPSAAAELLKSGGIPASVKTLNLGGEALPNALAQGLYALETVEKVGNLYGPTEDTTYSTYYVVPRGADQVLVGTPVANTRAYVLDAHLQPVPIGVVGELYLAGDGLSRGYANRPGMTAERFVPCPFGAPGARMYRVMDRVRRRADGELEYLGRIDFQVKVRGYRIELGEIEARLAEHPGVRAPVVVVREDAPGDRRLVAYYLGDEPVAVDALKAHLSDRLPGYMVPAAYVWMETYPLTPNGKVDRRALTAPEGDAYAAREYAAPVGETERALAGIWAEVLGVERVGRHDNFFELGGHSLLAVQVISRMRQVLGVEAPLAHLFSHPTVESLAARLSGSGPGVQDDRAIAIRPSGSQPPLFLVYEGTGSIAYAQVLHPHVGGDIPVYALPAPPADAPLRTVEGMATRLVRMIREVQPSGPYRLAGWSIGGVLAYEVAAQLIGRDEVVEFVGMFDSYHPAHAGAAQHDAAQEHALLLHVLQMAETVESNGRVGPEEAGVATGDVDLETFVTRCRERGLLPGHVTVEQARGMRDRLRDHRRALREYSLQPLPVAVHLFPARQSADPELSRGWRATLPATQLRVTPVPGTHLSIMRPPNAATLGEALSRALGRAREEAPRSAADSSPLVTLQGGAAGAAPLFCVPGAGSGVTSFVDLMLALVASVPVHGLQPRGVDGEAPPHSTVQAATEHYLRALREACPAGPVHLLGHSFGGWVALEMALRLHAAGRPVASLTILDSEVPDDSEAAVREYGGGEAFLKLVEVVELTAERSLGIGPAEVASRDEAGWLKLLHGKMVALGLLPARATPDVLAGPLRTFARCLRTAYRPLDVYPGRLRLVLVDDPRMDEAANRANFAQVERGWRKWAPGLVFSVGAGNHVTALKPPHVAALAAILTEDRIAREG